MLGTLVLLLAGCLPSVNPFFTENDLVFDPRLLGEWQTPKDQDDPPTEWQFERGEGKAYKLTVVEKKTKRTWSRSRFSPGTFCCGSHKWSRN